MKKYIILMSIIFTNNLLSMQVENVNNLTEATRAGDSRMVKVLINSGANVNAQDNHRNTALMWAAFNGYEDIVQMLLNAGADVNIQDYRGKTALMWAVYRGHEYIVEMLLDAGADITTQDYSGSTALDWAVMQGYLEIAEILNWSFHKLNSLYY